MPKQLIKSVRDPVSDETVFCFPPAATQPSQEDITKAITTSKLLAKQLGKPGIWKPAIATDGFIIGKYRRILLGTRTGRSRIYVTTSKHILILGSSKTELIDNFWTKTTYLSGRTVYSRGAFSVPKRYVYETPRSLKEILMFRNLEVRRILLERFGIEKIANEPQVVVLNHNFNEIENSWELLLALQDTAEKLFLCGCPSTGRRYILFVTQSVFSCKAAQKELWGRLPATVRMIGRS